MSDLDELRALLGAPPRQGPPIDWDAANQALGVAVPADFRDLAEAFGPGKIGNDTLLLEPYAANPNYDLVRRHQRRARALEVIWNDEADYDDEDQTKPPVFDEPGVRPVLWAASGLGFYLYWVTRDGTDPATWQIAVEPGRDGEWQFHAGTATNFLLRLLRGTEPTWYLQSLSDTSTHTFTPATD